MTIGIIGCHYLPSSDLQLSVFGILFHVCLFILLINTLPCISVPKRTWEPSGQAGEF